MKHTNKAFTLIELLVVIVIIGILSVISTTTFTEFKDKSYDASRHIFVNQAAKILIAEAVSTQQNDPEKFNFSGDEIITLFSENNLKVESAQNICPQVVVTLGPESDPSNGSSEDNELCVITWGTTTSTNNPSSPGPIYAGTDACKEFYADTTEFNSSVFACNPVAYNSKKNWELFPSAYAQIGETVIRFPQSLFAIRQYYLNKGQTDVPFSFHGGGYIYPIYIHKIKSNLVTEMIETSFEFVCVYDCPE